MATSGLQPLLLEGPQTNTASKRQRANSVDITTALQHDDYTVGWICALPIEMAAAEAMLDHLHDALPQHDFDTNTYTLGSSNRHNIVIACLPKGQYGTNNAVSVSNHMARSFPRIAYRFVVGIGGGVPSKAMPGKHFQRIATPVRPPQALMTAVSKLQASHSKGQNNMMAILLESTSHMPHYKHPMLQDRLFRSKYTHIRLADSCDSCDLQQLVHRDSRRNTDPVVHYGRIASGNQVIKDSVTRDQLSEDLGCICFEMESAGVMETFPCLAIRGICDYSDSHKNKEWQNYAAMVAASYVKELLTAIPIASVRTRKRQRVEESNISSPRNPDIDDCLRTLVATDAAQDRQDILDAKGDICKGTCEWIFSTKQFKAWQREPSHLLWISGPPGMGKTYLAIFLSKHFERISNELPGTKTVFFFCDNQHETRSTAVNILRGLLDQLISFRRDLVYTIMPYWYQRSSQLFEDSSFSILWRLLEEMVERSGLNVLYCVIDALEECEESSLIMLLRKLERHSKGTTTESTKIKFVCLSRRFPERIGEHFLDCIQIDLVTTRSRKQDINCFISHRVRDLARKKNFSNELQRRVEQIFQQRSEETFLWVSFMTMDLEQKRLMDIEASLEMLPSGLDAVYDKIISRIDQSHLDSVVRLLNWVLIATRPLRIPELCEILDVTPTPLLSREIVCLELIKLCGHLLRVSLNRTGSDFPFRDKQSRLRTESRFGLLSPTGFRSRPLNDQASGLEVLAAEGGSKMPHFGFREPICSERTTGNTLDDDDIDYWSLEVTFLHQSAKDYLTKRKMLSPLRTYDFCIPGLNQLATSLLTRYIENVSCYSANRNTEQTKVLQIMERLPLASYAIENWHHHARECNDISPVIRQDSGFFNEVSESRALWQRLCTSVAWRFQGSSTIPLLHLSCIIGLESLAVWCVERHQTFRLDMRWGGQGKTPLHEACKFKHEAIANILLNAGADALIMDKHNCTSIHYAVQKCSRELLSRMALQKPCAKWLRQQADDSDSCLLSDAAGYGNEGTCRFLLEEFAWDVNRKEPRLSLDDTPVMSALVNGHFKLARILISDWQAHFEDWRALNGTVKAFSRGTTEKMIRFLISDCFVDINATDPAGHSILPRLLHKRA
ncbi:heterokaryon incompatibility protein het-E-1 [Fusarium subglutinans]|uniref:Heterokaryon incompatibility protein het-E-1 n=1 Tax=Gibberella subglutinans TaxID=42677 RepID=A0A8H5UYG2_GIBSU|nr:heterokaryon incompatibility protein het-E-1 [Fusarium subglutinans]KAF5602060.1 heterokaryon incompatibility protein het-E-1 [Fusarium subglutinans]